KINSYVKKKHEILTAKSLNLTWSSNSNHCDSIKELAKDLSLQAQRIYRWRSECKTDPERSFRGHGVEKQSPEENSGLTFKYNKPHTSGIKKTMGIPADQNAKFPSLPATTTTNFPFRECQKPLSVSRSGYYS